MKNIQRCLYSVGAFLFSLALGFGALSLGAFAETIDVGDPQITINPGGGIEEDGVIVDPAGLANSTVGVPNTGFYYRGN